MGAPRYKEIEILFGGVKTPVCHDMKRDNIPTPMIMNGGHVTMAASGNLNPFSAENPPAKMADVKAAFVAAKNQKGATSEEADALWDALQGVEPPAAPTPDPVAPAAPAEPKQIEPPAAPEAPAPTFMEKLKAKVK